MKSIVTNAADITILSPIEYGTYKTGGGPASVGATVVQASMGQPGKILRVLESNWQDILGKPYPQKIGGVKMEGLRHVNDALLDCNFVNVVRVLASDAEFPSISLEDDGETPAVTKDSHAFGTELAAGTDVQLVIWVIDGYASTARKVNISAVDDANERFTITFTDVDENGTEYTLEEYTVGLSADDVDDMGQPAFLETVLENNSDRFRADWNDEDFTWAEFSAAVASAWTTAQTFTGGTDGGTPTSEDWQDAWDLFRNESVACNIMFAAGNTDSDGRRSVADRLRRYAVRRAWRGRVFPPFHYGGHQIRLDSSGYPGRPGRAFQYPYHVQVRKVFSARPKAMANCVQQRFNGA